MRYLLIIQLVLIASCASSINQKSASIHINSAQSALKNSDWNEARKHWAKAVVNADLSDTPEKTRAILYYEYGRSLGVTCFFSESENYLNKAYDLDKKTDGPFYMSLLELARLNFDQLNYQNSSKYYELLIPELEKLGLDKEAPVEYSNILNEYSYVLSKLERIDLSNSIKSQAELISSSSKGYSITDRTPYGKYCEKNG